jgi:hypothetical protein
MSLDDKEIRKRLSKADEEVTSKIAEEGGDAEAMKRGLEGKKETRGVNEQEVEEDVEDIGNDVDENAPSPT